MLLRKMFQGTAIKLAQSRQTIYGNNVQMTLQQIHNIEIKATLASKEKKHTTDRKKLFPGGKGRLVTGDEFLDDLKANAELVRQKELEIERRRNHDRSRKAKPESVGEGTEAGRHAREESGV
jgi:hypothetical protein